MNKITIRTERCKGCGLCVSSCPKGLLRLAHEKLNGKGYHPAEMTDEEKCIACAMCATMCPDAVIKVEKE